MADALIDSSPEAGDPPPEVGGELASLCDYVATALDRPLSVAVAEKAKHHLIDTVAAMVTGARLPAGELAIGYVRSLGGTGEAMVVGTSLRMRDVLNPRLER